MLTRAQCQRFDSILNAELAWQDFGRTVHRSDWPNIEPLPFIRLNVDLKEDPPALDAKDELANLQGKVKKALHHSASMRVEIQRVAFQLIASTFYVSRAVPLRDAEGTNAVSCRGNAISIADLLASHGELLQPSKTLTKGSRQGLLQI